MPVMDQDHWMHKYGDLGTGRGDYPSLSNHAVPAHVLRDVIASEREKGRAFGVAAEAARHELARRGASE